MPKWAGKWKGGRFYLDDQERRVFFIETTRPGIPRGIKLSTHDEDLAVGELARFRLDPVAYCRHPPTEPDSTPVHITLERLSLYMESIRHTVIDNQKARRMNLVAWSDLGLDLRTVDRKTLRLALAKFPGGHRGRTESLNAFCRWLVSEGDLPSWNPLVNHRDPEATRAERQAYGLDELHNVFRRLGSQWIKDLFFLRVSTGMHHTEIEQIEGCRVHKGPLPDQGVAIRTLDTDHEIRGVIQVRHKSRHHHRQSIDAAGLRAALRLRDGVPHRMSVWKAIDPIVPSNLRHTFVTLAGELGKLVTYTNAGVDRGSIAQVVGHRAGSTMTADRYDKLQVPPMIRLPFEDWNIL